MSSCPIGWQPAVLSDIAEITMGQSPAGRATNAIGEGLPLIGGASDLGENTPVTSRFTSAPTKRCEPGDIIYCIRATIGKLNIAEKQYCLGRGVAGFRSTGVDDRFLHWLLVSKRNDIADLGTGTTFLQVSKDDLATLAVPIPPLNEQCRIVAKLDALVEKSRAIRDKLDRLPRLLDQLKRSILNAAFRGDLTRGWRETSEARADAWCDTTLADVAVEFSYGSSAKSRPDGKIPVLRMGNIQDGRLDWSDLVYTDDRAEIEKYRLDSGDVLFNRTNSPDLVGKSAVFRGERDAIYAGYLIRVRCGKDLNPDFLAYLLNGPPGRQYCWQVKSDGVSQSNINARKLAAFSFQIPSRTEQQEIVRILDDQFSRIRALEYFCQHTSGSVGRMEASSLGKAFRGELVPQDPNDEPASVLLERIRAERAAGGPSRRTRTKRLTNST